MLTEKNRFSIAEYKGILSLAIAILRLPDKVLEPLKTSLHPNEEADDEHASQLARIRAALNDSISDASIRPVIDYFFYLEKENQSLADASLKLDYNQITPLDFILSNCSREQIETELGNIEEFCRSSICLQQSPHKQERKSCVTYQGSSHFFGKFQYVTTEYKNESSQGQEELKRRFSL